MGNLFRNVYSWFNSYFGNYLYEYFKGWDCNAESFSNPNQFATIGLITAIIALAVVILFYYIIDHPRFYRWWSWMIMLVFVALSALFYGFGKAYSDLNGGKIDDCLLYNITFNDQGEVVDKTQRIWNSNCWEFGIANMIIGIGFFIIFSFCLKWWSKTAKHSPI